MRLQYAEIKNTLEEILRKEGFEPSLASINAQIFTDSTLDGYHSHGINRFGEFVKNIRKGIVNPTVIPVLQESLVIIERYDGQQGAGPSNAFYSMTRAIELAKIHTLSCVALRNTNHWMRGGSYGWQAASQGCIAICFTNTMPNMPPWGGKTNTTGNNPLIIAVPKKEGHIVLDMSMSQFSYGKVYEHRLKGKRLPFPGGFDAQGNMTDDPDIIISTRRILQMGYWKGSGLSMMIDLLATLLSKGNSTSQIGELTGETALSQVFICIDLQALGKEHEMVRSIDQIIKHFKSSIPQHEDDPVRYPGEATAERRKKQMDLGILVDQEIWQSILNL